MSTDNRAYIELMETFGEIVRAKQVCTTGINFGPPLVNIWGADTIGQLDFMRPVTIERIRCEYCGCKSEKSTGTCDHCGAPL